MFSLNQNLVFKDMSRIRTLNTVQCADFMNMASERATKVIKVEDIYFWKPLEFKIRRE